MREETIHTNEAGQRLDKYLKKYLSEAPSSFIYKMLRKKNITLNKKKADGTEKLQLGDQVSFFFSDETLEKFHGKSMEKNQEIKLYEAAYFRLKNKCTILYEDDNIILFCKNAGVLTQKAKESDISLNEALIGYLLYTEKLSIQELHTFRPSVCNRLDRNTSGIVICGKSLAGLQTMSQLLKERSLHKYYRCFVKGVVNKPTHLEGYISKDEATNKVTIYEEQKEHTSPIITSYTPVWNNQEISLLEVLLVTGKTHQIRAHLASTGHPIIGDYKYGIAKFNHFYKDNFLVEHQLLHAYRLEFPKIEGDCNNLSEKIFTAEMPDVYQKIMHTNKNQPSVSIL